MGSLKRVKNNKKILNTLQTTYEFRKPYQIIFEEEFLKKINKSKLTVNYFYKLFFSSPKFFITECSYKIYKSKNLNFENDFSKYCEIRKCGHTNLNTEECLSDILKKNNKFHYFVATTNQKLKNTLSNLFFVPFIHLENNTLILESLRKNTNFKDNTLVITEISSDKNITNENVLIK
ncbi:putative rRNA-processing protein [Hamiltosporidium tvaerminnensis]|uniref:Putative rRNA-processing protein n=2 Tax=Hamiltosporidium TaxID=1176354 RepID=A0A4V2JWT0_9MICR|nr:hypothetical protein LUQ84_003009 [Hamiltosporidium tvaerminnensis]TBU02625.1 putative rRNA-processing protein [Hamiltosporidium tvaerminnensis]TBU04317.1 putative rRNA-processing protein [Hamiltosporidium magnivora]TBU09112.1 putative rRNA-processing protein [Hamiltosporidium magnivora]TBU13227.1 putative rRNA-processing protein [Hamiltosporidium tvaerminnensis]